MKKKNIIFIAISLATVLSFTGCTYTTEYVENELETNEDGVLVLEEAFEEGQTSVTEEIPIEGEEFSLVCTYDTNDYPLNEWRVTSKKAMNMEVKTSGLPEGYEVHIEHVHADMVLRATTPNLDGITQDTMDDSDHRVPTKGFPINDEISYNNVFVIEGYTNQFYEMWGYCYGEYGHVSSSYKRLTEGNIREEGAYAQELVVVYDIVITPPDAEEGYVRSVYSSVLVPLVSEITYVQKDFLTGEVISSEEVEESDVEE